jgi:hypothetical protein
MECGENASYKEPTRDDEFSRNLIVALSYHISRAGTIRRCKAEKTEPFRFRFVFPLVLAV